MQMVFCCSPDNWHASVCALECLARLPAIRNPGERKMLNGIEITASCQALINRTAIFVGSLNVYPNARAQPTECARVLLDACVRFIYCHSSSIANYTFIMPICIIQVFYVNAHLPRLLLLEPCRVCCNIFYSALARLHFTGALIDIHRVFLPAFCRGYLF